jgi:hypothetical protein
MQKASDFDRKMLLLATQLSHKLEMKPALLSALEALLSTLKTGANNDAVVEAMTLIRCILKIAMKLLTEPVANRFALFSPFGRALILWCCRPVLMDTLVNHFRTGMYHLQFWMHLASRADG